ncbi:MAG: hypothetical protein H8E64_09430 [Candidatus Marinimicrobia bacterium]|nr:hypothetical protein [Candidatus Neomarinimicrobiota bacterium]
MNILLGIAVIGIAILGMSLGVIFRNKPLPGSCNSGQGSCACSDEEKKYCENENSAQD